MPRWADEAWTILKESVTGYINDNALSHGAAMAFYVTTSLAPILLIVVAIAGIVIGNCRPAGAVGRDIRRHGPAERRPSQGHDRNRVAPLVGHFGHPHRAGDALRHRVRRLRRDAAVAQ